MINLKNKTMNIEWKLKNQFGYSFSLIRLINQPSYLAAVQTIDIEHRCITVHMCGPVQPEIEMKSV